MFPRISAVRGATIRATAVIASTFFLRTRTRTFCFVDNTIFSRGAGAAFSRQVARVAFTGSTRGTSLPSYTQPSRMSTSAVPKESMASAAAPKFVVAACQILCGGDRASNIASAEQAVKDAAAAGAQVNSSHRWCSIAKMELVYGSHSTYMHSYRAVGLRSYRVMIRPSKHVRLLSPPFVMTKVARNSCLEFHNYLQQPSHSSERSDGSARFHRRRFVALDFHLLSYPRYFTRLKSSNTAFAVRMFM